MNKIEAMKIAGQINKNAINLGIEILQKRANLLDVDQVIGNYISIMGGIPAFKGYINYPANSCLSVNDEVVHSIPKDYIPQDNDIITIDLGTKYNGFCVDSAKTTVIGARTSANAERIELSHVCQSILRAAIQIIRPGISLFEIAEQCDIVADSHKVYINNEFGGHGIGTSVHENPIILHTTKEISIAQLDWMKSTKLYEGQTICIEPIITKNKTETYMSEDGFTIKTKDGSYAAHFEDTILVTSQRGEILT